jgi:2-dehydro-3-deoxyphosphogluconate aldolase/(4S)-4-hydroxy-2-oxoglutarate aldolase
MKPLAYTTLLERRMISVIRGPSSRVAIEAAKAVARGGIALVEITFTVPDAIAAMKGFPATEGVLMGAGTVLTGDQCRVALDAGARFIVAPNLSLDVAKVAVAAGVMYCPGAYTTTEILAARDAGAHVIKVYPVGVAGGPDYIKIIRDPLPDIPMLAAGGTNLDNLVPFLRAGCVGVGLGAAIADPVLAEAGRFDEITQRARTFVARVADLHAAERPPGAVV